MYSEKKYFWIKIIDDVEEKSQVNISSTEHLPVRGISISYLLNKQNKIQQNFQRAWLYDFWKRSIIIPGFN